MVTIEGVNEVALRAGAVDLAWAPLLVQAGLRLVGEHEQLRGALAGAVQAIGGWDSHIDPGGDLARQGVRPEGGILGTGQAAARGWWGSSLA